MRSSFTRAAALLWLTFPAALGACGGTPGPAPAEASSSPPAGPAAAPATAAGELKRLFAELDADADGRITHRDAAAGQPLRAQVRDRAGVSVAIEGPVALAHVAELLAKQAARAPDEPPRIDRSRWLAPRTEIVRSLVRRSWDRLVRRSDRLEDIVEVLQGSHVPAEDGRRYVYFPQSDTEASASLRAQLSAAPDDVVLVGLPRTLDGEWLARLDRDRGLLYLPRPYLVPGGRFDEMYGWDSYFMARGAMADGELELAVDVLDNFLYQLQRYGNIGNSNRSYHRGRSQPPFLPRLALEVADRMGPADASESMLRRAAEAAERELSEVWMAPPRLTDTGLSRYRDEAAGPPPEVPRDRYRVWRETPEFYAHQRAVRESGWDMTHRFGERAHRIVPVCLNALLFAYERDLAEIHRRIDGPRSAAAARLDEAAERRRQRMDRLLWDEERGLYFDWDLDRQERTDYEHVASLYVLWSGAASPEQAQQIVDNLGLFESAGGLAVSSERSRRAAGGEQLQWDWPYGWAPHQVLAVEGLRRYDYDTEADRIAVAWLSLLLDVAGAHNGTIKEKYDVVSRTADVPAEYGNQGTDRGPLVEWISGCDRASRGPSCARLLPPDPERPVGFGWTNASYVLLLEGLSPDARAALDAR